MADVDAAVTDTHALLFHAAGSGRLGTKAARVFERCEQRAAIVYVPAAVMWETSLLTRLSRINLHRGVRAFFADLFSNPAFQPLELTAEHVFEADTLSFTHDPFDALIVAAARTLRIPLVTRDLQIQESRAVPTVW